MTVCYRSGFDLHNQHDHTSLSFLTHMTLLQTCSPPCFLSSVVSSLDKIIVTPIPSSNFSSRGQNCSKSNSQFSHRFSRTKEFQVQSLIPENFSTTVFFGLSFNSISFSQTFFGRKICMRIVSRNKTSGRFNHYTDVIRALPTSLVQNFFPGDS